ncbi:exodeoxyribonuclease V subunit beta [Gemmatimonas phototrophica]|uniref:DNA 3'-5' helicase n=1 Tax=Gemmatimonas phototrophica TaxID=1379270 RepID=A0A143BLL5_9BACT|nr:exodeoxyribonuclease V subunit beta [Gemmatimonas phototrophica]AMW05936.1 hypothetical protein GEMMAAP_16310 [Gemmatimonas phototrophica]
MTRTAVPDRTQFAVDTSPFAPGVSLVEASAGTGKTFNIAMSVIRLLLEKDAHGEPVVKDIGNILVVTFTVAATDELVERIRGLLRWAYDVSHGRPTNAPYNTQQLLLRLFDGREEYAQQRLARALAELDTLAVFTIHGFCKRILDEFALESGTAFGATLLEDEEALLLNALQDWWRTRFYADGALAGYAVQRSWQPDTFLSDYRLWARFPDVRVDPTPAFDEARQQAQVAIEAFAAVWDERAFRSLVADMEWTQKSPFHDPAQFDELMSRAAEAQAGRLGAAEVVGRALCVESLQDVVAKRSNAQKAKRDQIAEWPVAQAASRLGATLETMQQAVRVDCLGHVRAWLVEEKRRRNQMGFDDLLESLSTVLAAQGADGLLATAIRSQFHAALIDEFQDTDIHQFRIFDTAFAGRPLFLIGDPKQAIYAFRGADVHAYLAAVERASPQFTLGENYRSTPAMVEAVNAVFSQRLQPFVEDAIGFHGATAARNEGPPAILSGTQSLHWLFVGPEERRGKWTVTSQGTARQLIFAACVRHMAQQIRDGWEPRHMAVLVRTAAEGQAMAELLRAHDIPAVVSGMGNILQSAEMLELQLVLEAVASPRHEARVRAAMATHLWGSGAPEVQQMSQAGCEAEWDAVVASLTALRDTWVSHGFLQMTQELLAQRTVAERVLAFRDGDRRLTNLRHAVELLHHATVDESLNSEGILRWISQQRAERPREADISELRLETDADAVQILTIHKSKGLQFDLVYCPTLFRGRPTDTTQPLLVHEGGQVVFDHGSANRTAREQQAEVERLAEDCRLAYVALTRARFRTYVGWGAVGNTNSKVSGAWFSALAYLLSDQPGLDQQPTSDRPAAVAEWFRSDCTRYEAALQALVRRYPSHMALEMIDTLEPPVRLHAGTAPQAPHFAARLLPDTVPVRTRFDTFAVTSFTGLTAGAHAFTVAAPRDVDDVGVNTTQSVQALPRSDFRRFPAGRRAGTLLHTLFEHSRFDDTPALLRDRVAGELLREQIIADRIDDRVEAVAQMMHAVFTTPLPSWSFTLAQLSTDRARHEWEFLLPFADAESAFTRQAIALAFETHGGPDGVRYAAMLRQLGGARLHGFLTGFVDLVCEHDGKWYVIDWKSNQLGADPAAYGETSLQAVMDSSHYTLQYHLYLVALHRYLRTRLPHYDIDVHLGGAAYAFLRGFAPGASVSGHGWFTHRPPRALIEALSAVMDRRGRRESA